MKHLAFCLLAFLTFITAATAQQGFIIATTDTGEDYMLGMQHIEKILPNPSGGSILHWEFSERNYYSDESIQDLVDRSCGLFFIVDEVGQGQVAINVLYVERIVPMIDDNASIKLKWISERIETTNTYVSLLSTLNTCNIGTGGSMVQTLLFNSPILSISGGNSVDLSALNTDDQKVVEFSWDPETLTLTLALEGDGEPPYEVVLSGIGEGGGMVGDNWGSQVVIHDGTMTGTGTLAYPLSSAWEFNITDGVTYQTLNYGETITFESGPGLTESVYSPNKVKYAISTHGASDGDVLSYIDGSVVWDDGGGGFRDGDDWGDQVVIHDETLTGDGTTLDPLSVDLTAVDTDNQQITEFSWNTETHVLTIEIENDTSGNNTVDLGGVIAEYRNGITETDGYVEWGGTLIKNTTINQANYNTSFQNVGIFRADRPYDLIGDSPGDAIVLNSTGAALTGADAAITVHSDEITVEAGTDGHTYWRYGTGLVGIGSFLQTIDGGTNEVAYAPYRMPTNNVGEENKILITDSSGNLVWGDPGAGSSFSFTITDGSTSQIVEDAETVTYSGTNLIVATVSATNTVSYGIDATGIAQGQVLTADGNDGVEWSDPASGSGSDADWYDVLTGAAPDDITDNIYTLGKVSINSSTNSEQLTVTGDISSSGTDNAMVWRNGNEWIAKTTANNLIFEPASNASIRFRDYQSVNKFSFNSDGTAQFHRYTELIDDSGTHEPTNFFYSDAQGRVYVAPLTAFTGAGGDEDFYEIGTVVSPDDILDNKYTLGKLTVGSSSNTTEKLNVIDGNIYIENTTPALRLNNGSQGWKENVLSGNVLAFTPEFANGRFRINSLGNSSLEVDLQRNFWLFNYPSSRNDITETQPLNFIYTDAGGQFLSAPIQWLTGGGAISQQFNVIDQDLNESEVDLANDENIKFIGHDILQTNVSTLPNDDSQVQYFFDVTGAASGDVITYDGSDIVWGDAGTGTYLFIKDNEGSSQQVDIAPHDQITFGDYAYDGVTILDARVTATDNVSYSITGGSDGYVLKWEGDGLTGGVSWVELGASAAGAFDVYGDTGNDNLDITTSEQLTLAGDNLLEAIVTSDPSGPIATIQIAEPAPAGSYVDYIISFDGTNVVWAPPSNGVLALLTGDSPIGGGAATTADVDLGADGEFQFSGIGVMNVVVSDPVDDEDGSIQVAIEPGDVDDILMTTLSGVEWVANPLSDGLFGIYDGSNTGHIDVGEVDNNNAGRITFATNSAATSSFFTKAVNATTNTVTYSILPSSTTGHVLTTTSGNNTVAWAANPAGVGNFDIIGADGGTQEVNLLNGAEAITFDGTPNGILTATVSATDKVTYEIQPGTATQVLTTNGAGNVVWADNPGATGFVFYVGGDFGTDYDILTTHIVDITAIEANSGTNPEANILETTTTEAGTKVTNNIAFKDMGESYDGFILTYDDAIQTAAWTEYNILSAPFCDFSGLGVGDAGAIMTWNGTQWCDGGTIPDQFGMVVDWENATPTNPPDPATGFPSDVGNNATFFYTSRNISDVFKVEITHNSGLYTIDYFINAGGGSVGDVLTIVDGGVNPDYVSWGPSANNMDWAVDDAGGGNVDFGAGETFTINGGPLLKTVEIDDQTFQIQLDGTSPDNDGQILTWTETGPSWEDAPEGSGGSFLIQDDQTVPVQGTINANTTDIIAFQSDDILEVNVLDNVGGGVVNYSIPGLSDGENKVLTSDGAGNASWEFPQWDGYWKVYIGGVEKDKVYTNGSNDVLQFGGSPSAIMVPSYSGNTLTYTLSAVGTDAGQVLTSNGSVASWEDLPASSYSWSFTTGGGNYEISDEEILTFQAGTGLVVASSGSPSSLLAYSLNSSGAALNEVLTVTGTSPFTTAWLPAATADNWGNGYFLLDVPDYTATRQVDAGELIYYGIFDGTSSLSPSINTRDSRDVLGWAMNVGSATHNVYFGLIGGTAGQVLKYNGTKYVWSNDLQGDFEFIFHSTQGGGNQYLYVGDNDTVDLTVETPSSNVLSHYINSDDLVIGFKGAATGQWLRYNGTSYIWSAITTESITGLLYRFRAVDLQTDSYLNIDVGDSFTYYVDTESRNVLDLTVNDGGTTPSLTMNIKDPLAEDKMIIYDGDTWEFQTNSLDNLSDVGGPLLHTNGNVLTWSSAIQKWTSSPPAGGTSYSFLNGLTETVGSVRLGGDLTAATVISTEGYAFDISDDVNGIGLETLPSSDQIRMYSGSGSNYIRIGGNIALQHTYSINIASSNSDVNITSANDFINLDGSVVYVENGNLRIDIANIPYVQGPSSLTNGSVGVADGTHSKYPKGTLIIGGFGQDPE